MREAWGRKGRREWWSRATVEPRTARRVIVSGRLELVQVRRVWRHHWVAVGARRSDLAPKS